MDWLPLAGLTLVMGLTGLGYLPVPGTPGSLTLLHIPTILAGVLSGPLAGSGVGLLFGLTNCWLLPPHNLVVQLLPRLLCGFMAGAIFWLARRHGRPETQLTLGAICAAAVASLVHSLLVVGLAVAYGYMQAAEMPGILVFYGLPEAVMAVLITLPLAVVRLGRG